MKRKIFLFLAIVSVTGMIAISGCNKETYTVSFNPNGGIGTMEAQTFTEGEAQALNHNIYSREGYSFTGWNTTSNGTGGQYADGQTITATADMILYAQWTSNGTSGGGENPNPTPAPSGSPTVKTDTAKQTIASAVLNGNVTAAGDAPVSARGFMYGTNTNNLFNSVECGSGTGIFSETISELDIYTRYYYKAYATNAFGTAYGEIMSFTLAPIDSISGTFQWEKVGGEMGTGLEEFGLFWQANNFSKSVNVNIKPIEDARLYILTPSDYAINDLYTLNTRLESVGESTLYNGVSADYCADYNDVIATVYNGRTYLINITRGTVSSDSIGMRFVITGTYKMWEQYVSNK